MLKQLLSHLEERHCVECIVEGEKRPAELETVASEFKLVSCVDVLDCKLNTGSVRALHQPHVVIMLFSLLEEDAVVASSVEAELVYAVFGYLSFNLGFLLSVGQ